MPVVKTTIKRIDFAVKPIYEGLSRAELPYEQWSDYYQANPDIWEVKKVVRQLSAPGTTEFQGFQFTKEASHEGCVVKLHSQWIYLGDGDEYNRNWATVWNGEEFASVELYSSRSGDWLEGNYVYDVSFTDATVDASPELLAAYAAHLEKQKHEENVLAANEALEKAYRRFLSWQKGFIGSVTGGRKAPVGSVGKVIFYNAPEVVGFRRYGGSFTFAVTARKGEVVSKKTDRDGNPKVYKNAHLDTDYATAENFELYGSSKRENYWRQVVAQHCFNSLKGDERLVHEMVQEQLDAISSHPLFDRFLNLCQWTYGTDIDEAVNATAPLFAEMRTIGLTAQEIADEKAEAKRVEENKKREVLVREKNSLSMAKKIKKLDEKEKAAKALYDANVANFPDAPYGRKADGTPMKKRGRAKAEAV